jgi:hypothetical protein
VKNILLGCLVLVIVLNSPLFAERKFDFVIEPTLTFGQGYTKYVLDETGYLDNANTIVGHVKSELKFPLNGQCAGLSVGLRSKPYAKGVWSLMASYALGVSDPRDKMYDRDWINWPHTFDGLFSYTESDVKHSSHSGSLEGRVSFQKGRRISFGLAAGAQFQKFSQDLVNLDGWQVDPSTGGDTVYTFSMTGEVGYYSVTWKTVYGGPWVDICPLPSWDITLMAAFAPTWVNDKDLHLLRNRESWATGNGRGFIARAQTELDMGNAKLRFRPVLGLSADLYSFSVKGTQTIYYYGDDPATPGNDTKTSYGGVPHQMTSQQLNLTLRLGVRF